MDYVRQLGALVLDHRFRRIMEQLLRAGEDCYTALELPFRARWASTYLLLEEAGPLGITEIADALRLTHPAVIAITDEMRDAGIVSSSRDRTDARRRAVALTAKGRSYSKSLHQLWSAMGQAQRRLFSDAGCDIVAVLDAVDDRLAQRPLGDEILQRARTTTVRGKTRAALTTTALALFSVVGSLNTLHAQLTVDAKLKTSLVEAIADSLVGGYIYADRARVFADSLRGALRAGRFDTAHDVASLGTQLTDFLFSVTKDRHLNVGHSGASTGERTPDRRPTDSSLPTLAVHGIERYEILPGNVGYVELRMFSGAPGALARIDTVMAHFANVHALVLDLRKNIGGGPVLIQHLSAYLFAKPTHLVSTFTRGMAQPQERWTRDSVPGKRLPNVPVYILTSRNTFSAGESFTFGLKVTGRATLVGERTGGGGHFGRVVPLIEGFRMFLPVGRTYDPRTQKGWEAEGIAPDVDVPQERALERALELIRSRPA